MRMKDEGHRALGVCALITALYEPIRIAQRGDELRVEATTGGVAVEDGGYR
jgi:hypothetical protein